MDVLLQVKQCDVNPVLKKGSNVPGVGEGGVSTTFFF